MKPNSAYTFKLRPGYGSEELLIELDGKDQPDELQTDLILLLEQNGFKLTELKDMWQNNEWSFIFRSKQGVVQLSRDSIWDLFFIMGENNQSDILKLDKLLLKNPLFEKLNVNYSDYQ